MHEASNNIVIAKDCTISLLGVKNLIVVKNGDNILISYKESVQDIKKVVYKYNVLRSWLNTNKIDMKYNQKIS